METDKAQETLRGEQLAALCSTDGYYLATPTMAHKAQKRANFERILAAKVVSSLSRVHGHES